MAIVAWWLQGGAVYGLIGAAIAAWLFAGTMVQLAERIHLFRVPWRESLRRLGRMPRAAGV